MENFLQCVIGIRRYYFEGIQSYAESLLLTRQGSGENKGPGIISENCLDRFQRSQARSMVLLGNSRHGLDSG